MKKNLSGFTLVELAIVLMIIGLLIGGVLKGQEMANNARITGVIKQINSFSSAYHAFYDAYSAKPGDMATATFRIPGCTNANNCYNGNSNSIVGSTAMPGGTANFLGPNQIGLTDEPRQAWQHLALAGYISGVIGGANQLAYGDSHPASVMGLGGFHFQYLYANAPGMGVGNTRVNGTGHYIRLQGPINQGPLLANGANPLSPQEAFKIDTKMDDGDAGGGWMVTEDGAAGDNGCDGAYTPSITQKNCGAAFMLDK